VGRTRYARNGPYRIAYERRGAWHRKRPWLLLIQGLGFDRSGWEPLVRELRPYVRLLLVDNRGSGRSDAARGHLAVADMAGDARSVLDAARIRKAHVLGVSLGGMVAQEVALRYPERVDRLVLMSTTPGWPSGYPMPAPSVGLLSATGRMPPEQALRRHVENSLARSTVASRPELVDRLIAHQRAHPPHPDGFRAQMAAGARYTGNSRQTRIRAPTLVMHGTADTVVDIRNAKLLATRIPDAELNVLPDLGHLFFWEDPKASADAVLTFLGLGPTRRGG
jgi:pimeloyl-ACP methyl ester carboxylesterase